MPTTLTYSDSGFEVLWDQGYVPASKLLILEGVSPAQVELQMRRVKALFGIVEPSDLISFPQELLAELVADFRAEIANEPTLSVQRLDERVIKEISEFRVEMWSDESQHAGRPHVKVHLKDCAIVRRQMVWDIFQFSERRLWFILLRVKLSGFQLMLQATILDCSFLDPFPFFQDGLSSSKVDIRRGEIVQALM